MPKYKVIVNPIVHKDFVYDVEARNRKEALEMGSKLARKEMNTLSAVDLMSKDSFYQLDIDLLSKALKKEGEI